MTEGPRICDYGDSTYRQDFWEGQGRGYEDAVERHVLQRLLPARGSRLLEIGAGFGRITNEYHMFRQVVLLDYSLEQLQYARAKYGDDGFLYVAADAYRMPFRPRVFDSATMIRVIHHFEDLPAVLWQVREALADNGAFILEYANKRNLKAMLRHLFGLNNWNPYTLEPIEFVELNFNFHPEYVQRETARLGFEARRVLPVSWFRLALFKRALPMGLLAALDSILQRSRWVISPSVFLELRLDSARGNSAVSSSADPLEILRCPQSGAPLRRDGDVMLSEDGTRWGIRDGVYDFRQPSD